MVDKVDSTSSPEVYVASRQPLQASNIQDRHLVPRQAESLQASELLQHRGHAGERVEGQAEVREALQRRQFPRQSAQTVTVQEESLQAGDTGHTNIRKARCCSGDQDIIKKRKYHDPDQTKTLYVKGK